MVVQSFKELTVWQRGMELVKEVYRITEQLPPTERHGLVSQMQRAAVSIPSNIAEGRRRGTRPDYLQFLRIADGSAAELETQLLLARDLHHTDTTRAQSFIVEVQKMLITMIRGLTEQPGQRREREFAAELQEIVEQTKKEEGRKLQAES